ncbi:GNAT family N-acetyltransferase [Streptomyces sp. NPDC059477]|uniref:GNAT family N-acetyltransferase n=1 Tax=Streptomyces sp. NPDC059477 TaxID=3346847 RepID=UPI003687A434
MRITRVDAARLGSLADDLADLLVDTVGDGASVGFLAPLERAEALAWWGEWAAGVAEGRRAVWVATETGAEGEPEGERDGDAGADRVLGRETDDQVAREVARAAGRVVGTVSLAFPGKPNSRHRAELVKLMVHRDARGRGLGRRLLTTAEEAAAASGVTLLHLDTETDSGAERLYGSAGWTRIGAIPDYAADPQGVPRPTSIYYKRLGPHAHP